METVATLSFADSKTTKEDKRKELFETLKTNDFIGWVVDVIDPRELSAKMIKNKINLNEISHDSAMGLIDSVLKMGVFLTEGYMDTVKDSGKYEMNFPSIKFVVAKKADSLYPVVNEGKQRLKFQHNPSNHALNFDDGFCVAKESFEYARIMEHTDVNNTTTKSKEDTLKLPLCWLSRTHTLTHKPKLPSLPISSYIAATFQPPSPHYLLLLSRSHLLSTINTNLPQPHAAIRNYPHH